MKTKDDRIVIAGGVMKPANTVPGTVADTAGSERHKIPSYTHQRGEIETN